MCSTVHTKDEITLVSWETNNRKRMARAQCSFFLLLLLYIRIKGFLLFLYFVPLRVTGSRCCSGSPGPCYFLVLLLVSYYEDAKDSLSLWEERWTRAYGSEERVSFLSLYTPIRIRLLPGFQ